VNAFELSSRALDDLRSIIRHRAKSHGVDSADDLEDEFLSAFSRLAENPGLGHRREDLTPKPYFFYTIHPYLIVYAREADPLPILGVLHGARDLQKILKRR